MLETEKADGDKDVKSGLTHLVQPPVIFLMCGLGTQADLMRVCWHGHVSAFAKVIPKNIGSRWVRHLVPRIWDQIKTCRNNWTL